MIPRLGDGNFCLEGIKDSLIRRLENDSPSRGRKPPLFERPTMP